MSASPGPLCTRCGCARVEHRVEVDETFHLVTGECLTCSECPRFEGDDTVPRPVAEEA